MSERSRVVRPTIVGPPSWPADGSPPRFHVDTAGRPLYMVELATDPHLMSIVADRTAHNYFYGGDGDNVFATGPGWCVPTATWAHLQHAGVLYYRVVTFDHTSGNSELSVDDHQLDALPLVVVQDPGPDLHLVHTARQEKA
jgi:hypothetical protein